MKYVYLALGLLLALAMIAQLNDVDPWPWIILYGGCGIVCAAAAFNIYNPWVPVVGIAVIIVALVTQWSTFTLWMDEGMPSIGDEMKATHSYIEEVREFLGLSVCGLILIFIFLQKRFTVQKNSSL